MGYKNYIQTSYDVFEDCLTIRMNTKDVYLHGSEIIQFVFDILEEVKGRKGNHEDLFKQQLKERLKTLPLVLLNKRNNSFPLEIHRGTKGYTIYNKLSPGAAIYNFHSFDSVWEVLMELMGKVEGSYYEWL